VFVALFIQDANPMLPVILSSMVGRIQPYFSTLSNKRRDFRKNIIEHIMYFDFSYNLSVKHVSF